MNDFRKKEIENSGALSFVKKYTEKYKREYNEYFVSVIANYIDSLQKLNVAFPVDMDKVMESFVSAVANISLVNPITSETKFENNNLYIANNRKLEDIDIDFFSEFTNIVVKKGVFKSPVVNKNNPLQNANNECITQLVYSVSKNPAVALQLNEDSDNKKPSSYSNMYSNNPVMSSLLNLVAVSTGLSINYVLSLSFKENGEELLREQFDKVHGEGSFSNFMQAIDEINVNKKNADPTKTESMDINYMLDSKNNSGNTNDLSNFEYEKIKQIEYVLVQNFFEKHDDDFIKENYEKLEESITSNEVKEHYSKEIEKIRSNISIRKLEDKTGFIALKYVIATTLFILIIIVLAVLVFK